ncbi:MAG: RluA family pseudouridine synthase [Ruminococcus sp.]|jgi:23S rRNA pseudouridine955/2504/2580 synthase
MQILTISKNEAGQRLDKYLQKYLNLAPKSFIYKMMRKKNILLNGRKAVGNEKTVQGDEVRLYLSDETISGFRKRYQTAPYRRLDVIYEDNHVLVVNKPTGMLSQKSREDDISLNEYVISYLIHEKKLTEESLSTFRPGVCNRLDRNTSGLVLAGKTVYGLQKMSALLKERDVHKYYLCLVHGEIKKKQRICGYLHKQEKCNKVEIYQDKQPDSSYIETAYEPLASNGSVTLLKVLLVTGRTHQIRSHLAACGHGLIGDMKYGDTSQNEAFRKKYGVRHQLLHSWRMRFPLMEPPLEGLSKKVLEAPVPEIFTRILKEEQLGGVNFYENIVE